MSSPDPNAALQDIVTKLSNPSAPLTEANYQQMLLGLRIADLMQPHLDKAKQAGVNVDAAQQSLNDARQKILNLKNVYFPGR